jgi:putative iron-regulated protein
VVDGLLDQTKSIEGAVAALDLSTIKFEGSDSLDNPEQGQRRKQIRWGSSTGQLAIRE